MDNDLISRSALIKELLSKNFYPSIVKSAIEKAPAVSIVRCKDCAYSYHRTAIKLGCGCEDVTGNIKLVREVTPDDFCSHGIDWRDYQKKMSEEDFHEELSNWKNKVKYIY